MTENSPGAVIVVRHRQGRTLDPTLTAVCTGAVSAYGDWARHDAAGLTSIAWIVDDIPASELDALARDVASVWHTDELAAVLIGEFRQITT